MKKILLVILICLGVSSCYLESSNLKGSTEMPFNYKARLMVKDYENLGRVRGEYQRYCVLFGLFCCGDTYSYDDLMNKAHELGGDSVINFTVDEDVSTPFWWFLFYRRTIKTNGLAVKLKKSNFEAKELYLDD